MQKNHSDKFSLLKNNDEQKLSLREALKLSFPYKNEGKNYMEKSEIEQIAYESDEDILNTYEQYFKFNEIKNSQQFNSFSANLKFKDISNFLYNIGIVINYFIDTNNEKFSSQIKEDLIFCYLIIENKKKKINSSPKRVWYKLADIYSMIESHEKSLNFNLKLEANKQILAKKHVFKDIFDNIEAIKLLLSEIENGSKDIDIYELTTSYYFERCEFSNVLKICKKAENLGIKFKNFSILLALSLLQIENKKEGYAVLEHLDINDRGIINNFYLSALKYYPISKPMLLGLAEFYIISKQYPEAKKILKIILTRDLNCFTAHYLAAFLNQCIGDYPKAINIYSMALKLDNNSLDTLKNIAQCHNIIGEYDKSIEYLHSVLAIAPKESDTIYQIGILYLKTNKFSDAINQYNQLKEVNHKLADKLFSKMYGC